ncbi:transcription elongation factor Spt5 [Candidatus Bathyarchaeota archaeon]|nr:MAG: transcription elongation factor Spt5 [Candidatus Bathyarchaeota archaeon]
MKMNKNKQSTIIFAVRTTAGQERNVSKLIAGRAEANKIPIKAILVPDSLKGYIFIEAEGPHIVEQAISGIKHVKSRVPGLVSFEEIEKYIVIKPVIEELNVDDLVEVIGGPFKGMRAKITNIDRAKEEVTIELLEASFTLPVTVHADYLKLVKKGEESEEGT